MTVEESTEERVTRYAISALVNPSIGGLAAASWASNTDFYGKIPQKWSSNILRKAPDQDYWDRVFLDKQADGTHGSNSLLSDNPEFAGFTQGSVKAKCMKIVHDSLLLVPIEYALKLMGVNGDVSSDYAGKTVNDLDEEEQAKMFGTYMTDSAHNYAMATLADERKSLAKGLEGKFCEAPVAA